MRLHFIGIGGRAMGGIALALSRAGHDVTGSDEDVYEPMKGCLARAGVQPTPFAAAHVPSGADAVIVGKRVTDDNPELRWARQHNLPCRSFPEFLRDQFLSRSETSWWRAEWARPRQRP